MVPGYLSDETLIPDMTPGKCGCNFGNCGISVKHQCLFYSKSDPVEHKTFSYMAPGETSDDYLYEELLDHALPIVGHYPNMFEELAPTEAISSNHTNEKL